MVKHVMGDDPRRAKAGYFTATASHFVIRVGPQDDSNVGATVENDVPGTNSPIWVQRLSLLMVGNEIGQYLLAVLITALANYPVVLRVGRESSSSPSDSS